ncbi:MAG: MASE1 domain-containing protein [Pseudomonadota bacterium]
MLLLPVLHFAAIQLSFFCGKTPENEVIIWMPNAVLLAALLRYRGERGALMALLTFATNVAGNLPTAPWTEAVLLSVVNLGEVGMTFALMRVAGASPRLDHMRDFVSFVVSGPLLAAFVAGLAGAGVISLYDASTPYATLMRVWWFDDGLGLLIFTPLLLLSTQPGGEQVRWRSFDFAMLAFSVALISLMYFASGGVIGDVTVTPTLLIPPILVIAMRFGIFWTALAVALVSLTTCRMVATGGQPFGAGGLHQTIIHTQEFVLTFSIICMGAAILRSQLRAHERNLEGKVKERTSELSNSLVQLKRTQADLVQAEKLASLGALVAGVAHELNTPIGNSLTSATVLQHHMEEMQGQLDAGRLVRSELILFFKQGMRMTEVLSRSCLRASELIESFKMVAVDRTSERRRCFLVAKLVREIEGMWHLGHKRAHFRIEIDIPADLECTSYPGPFGQVVTNLLQNAALHAFDEPSKDGRDYLLRVDAQASEHEITLRFADNGKGMDEDTLAHVFDPFFTTRLGVGGSGLGLSISRNLSIGVLGGSLVAESTLGKGSVFTLTFPRQVAG